MDKIEYYQERIKELTEMINSYDCRHFSKDWLMKMLDINKNDVRKNKIKKILDDKTGEI